MKENDKIKVLANFHSGEEVPLEIEVGGEIVDRASRALNKKGLIVLKIAAGVAVFAGAVGAGKKILDKEKRKREETVELTQEKREAFTRLFERSHMQIFSFLSSLSGDRGLAEEVTQEIYIRAYKSYDRFVPVEEVRDPEVSWVFKIARRVWLNTLRDRRRRPNELEGEIEDYNLKSEEEDLEKIKKLRQGLEKVSADDQFLILLKLSELDNKEIGEVYRISEEAVKGRYYRALKRLSNKIDKS